MFSFLSSAGNSGYFDRNEISIIKAKYNPGLELQLTTEYGYNSTKSIYFKKEIGILYKLKYGEIGAMVTPKSNPIAHFHGTLRRFSKLGGYKLTSMCVVDINRHKLDKLNGGLTMIAGNYSLQLNLDADNSVLSTRHRIHPRTVTLSEVTSPYIRNQ
ncbi:unnamed protein product [Arabis nemorensis]|uniref:Uncharacterized protein n=1 Tax=Arabis nemorensis TaxID=586526 RepID=A0A565BP73_9BRAS|nr:unnamed protein product [Arabis nemorensis]